jgi:anti-sigma B factor antagonist
MPKGAELMRMTERQFGDVVVLDLHGRIAGPKAGGLVGAAVRRHCRDGVHNLVLNLGGVPTVDLGGLGALLDAHTALRQAGGVFKLACVTKCIQDLVVITRLLTVFDTYDSVAEAVGGARPAYAGLKRPQPSSMSFGTLHRFLRRV